MTDLSLYLELDDIKGTAGITGSFSDDDINRALAAACRGLDQACGRPFGFYPREEGEIRYYKPQAADTIVIDDLISIDPDVGLLTSQFGNNVFDRTWINETTFTLDPYNAPAQGKPFTRIKINPWAAFVGFPFWAPRSAKVTGQFGWPTTPAGIIEATSLLTTRLLQRAKSAPLGVQFSADLASRIVFSDPDVRELARPYQREEVI